MHIGQERLGPAPESRVSHFFSRNRWKENDRRNSSIYALFLKTKNTHIIIILMVTTAVGRVLSSFLLGLGIDESYTVALGRELQLGYFDHPPLSWWLQWGVSHLLGSASPIIVRSPFIALFALSTWLLYRLTTRLFSETAGLWAVLSFNLAPVFGITSASWVLPDGPLDAALLGFMTCLTHALDPAGRRPWAWWLGTGVTAGLALLSKYIAIFVLLGAAAAVLAHPLHRRWVSRPHPWLAISLSATIFLPVILWNADHHWCSFAFQGQRSLGDNTHLFAPVVTLGGEALFLLPWIWLPMMMEFFAAWRRGPADWPRWLLANSGTLPILFFALVGIWSHSRVLFHWAAPGYLVLFPLLGAALARWTRRWGRVVIPRIAAASAILILVCMTVVGTQVRWNWLPLLGKEFAPGADPSLAAVDWTSLVPEMHARGLIGPGKPAVATLKWYDAGKLDYALGGTATIICLGEDSRGYGIIHPAAVYRGKDVLILVPETRGREVERKIAPLFDHITPLPALTVLQGGRPALKILVYLGTNFMRPDR